MTFGFYVQTKTNFLVLFPAQYSLRCQGMRENMLGTTDIVLLWKIRALNTQYLLQEFTEIPRQWMITEYSCFAMQTLRTNLDL